MRSNPTPVRGRGAVAAACAIWVAVAILLASSCSSTKAATASTLSPPTAAELVRLKVIVAKLHRQVLDLRAELVRLDRSLRAVRCVLRIEEDASSRLLDAEQVTTRCHELIGTLIGGGSR